MVINFLMRLKLQSYFNKKRHANASMPFKYLISQLIMNVKLNDDILLQHRNRLRPNLHHLSHHPDHQLFLDGKYPT